MRALLTGFGPFRSWTVNASGEAVRRVVADWSGAAALEALVLPVDHDAGPEALAAAVARIRPEVLLMAGLADEPRLRLEILARRPANRDAGPLALRGLWPWAQALDAMRAVGPSRLSEDPGRYVCETVYWNALAADAAPRIAFLHVPPLGPDWPVERVARGVAACLSAALR